MIAYGIGAQSTCTWGAALIGEADPARGTVNSSLTMSPGPSTTVGRVELTFGSYSTLLPSVFAPLET